MPHATLNPATGRLIETFPVWDAPRLQQALAQAGLIAILGRADPLAAELLTLDPAPLELEVTL